MEVRSIIEKMTLEQKIHLCTGANFWQTTAIEELGVPSLTMSDGTNGVRFQKKAKEVTSCNLYDATINFSFDNKQALDNTYEATCFPSGSALASSWSPELAEEIGRCVANECKALGIGLLLGPGMNIRRHPLTARNFEYYSEDPCLSGEMAAGMIRGIQQEEVGACVKHFICNNSDTRRTRLNCLVEERALREIYLAGFERAVKKAKPAAVMGAYNQINGQQACESKWLLEDVLRKEWGFQGVILSDWGAVKDSVKAAYAGLDLQMPHSVQYIHSVKKALDTGVLEEETLNRHCEHILDLVFRYSREGKEKPVINWDYHHSVACKAACESAVLLKNAGNLLPMDGHAGGNLAVIGAIAESPLYQGTGCAIVNAKHVDIPLDEIRHAAPEMNISYAKGYTQSHTSNRELLEEAKDKAAEADVAVVLVGTVLPGESDNYDHKNMEILAAHRILLDQVCSVQKNVIVIVFNGNAVSMPWADQVTAILDMGYCGGGVGKAVADLLFGRGYPGGKLAVTIPMNLKDTPAYLDFPQEQDTCRYREGIFVGYRYYDRRECPVRYPFGFGLGYTTFSCSDLQVMRQEEEADCAVSLTVTNTGTRAGSQVVQLYVSPEKGDVFRPEKELKAFAKVYLAPNEKRKVIFLLEGKDFSYYDDKSGKWHVPGGIYRLKAGFDSSDLRECVEIYLKGDSAEEEKLEVDCHYSDLFAQPEATKLFFEFLVKHGLLEQEQAGDEQLIKELSKTFWGVGQHLDMNGFGKITPDMVEALFAQLTIQRTSE